MGDHLTSQHMLILEPIQKLHGIGPMITDPPPTSFTTLSKKKREELLTFDM